ncbi:hypothetical protein H1R20_g8429, partial [Candolleomyces eurysporus]
MFVGICGLVQRNFALTNQLVQVIEAKTPAPVIGVEGEDARVDARMLKDDRVKAKNTRSFFSQLDDDELADKLG